MKSRLSYVLLALLTWVLVFLSQTRLPNLVTAQIPASEKLFYLYFDQAIPLNLRQDAIAVAPKLPRTSPNADIPFYLQLQQDLQPKTTRTSTNNHCPQFPIQIKPLRAEDYALISLPSQSPAQLQLLRQCLRARDDVASILPILNRPNYDELLVLPNEIIIKFEPKLSEQQIQQFLKNYPIQVIRQLRLSGNCYLVQATSASELGILHLANQLNNLSEIEYAAPNWIALPPSYIQLQIKHSGLIRTDRAIARQDHQVLFPSKITKQTRIGQEAEPEITNLLPWQWYLNSTPLTACLQQNTQLRNCLQKLTQCLEQGNPLNNCLPPISLPSRTDIHALEAWQQTNRGRGVVVAVIDSLIQWDHPDLQDHIYTINHPLEPNKYPGEIHGWDFIQEDPETRLSKQEKTNLQQALKADSANGEFSLVSAFHGTLVTGVIAAHSATVAGLLGVAPNVTILPVRAADMAGILDLVDEAEAIEYAANRGADIINMSFGGDPPHPLLKNTIAQVLANYPNLILVAGAGNDNSSQQSYPAAYEGVIVVGATTLSGNRAYYSNYGAWIDVVAPGGDIFAPDIYGGILTTGGTWQDQFWVGIPKLNPGQYYAFDSQGKYMWVQGTSFSTPIVSGVLALMRGEDPDHHISRDRLVTILKETASMNSLTVSDSPPGSDHDFFGSGLVNAEAAIQAIKN